MKIQANSVEEFFQASGEKESDLRQVDKIIIDTIPDLQCELKIIPSISMIAYWTKGTSQDEWPVLALAPQKNYISLYVRGVKEGQSLADYYANKLGKTKNGKGCVRFKRFSDVSIESLQQLVKDAFEL